MTSDFEGFSIPDIIHYIYFPILILEKEPVFYLLNVKQGHYWYQRLWYNAVLDWGLKPGPPALEASTIPLGYRGGGRQGMIAWADLYCLQRYSYNALYQS